MPFFKLEITPIKEGIPQKSILQSVRGKDMTTAIRSYAQRFLVEHGERDKVMLSKGRRVGAEMHYFVHKETGQYQCSMLASVAIKNPTPLKSIYG